MPAVPGPLSRRRPVCGGRDSFGRNALPHRSQPGRGRGLSGRLEPPADDARRSPHGGAGRRVFVSSRRVPEFSQRRRTGRRDVRQVAAGRFRQVDRVSRLLRLQTSRSPRPEQPGRHQTPREGDCRRPGTALATPRLYGRELPGPKTIRQRGRRYRQGPCHPRNKFTSPTVDRAHVRRRDRRRETRAGGGRVRREVSGL